MGNRAIITIEDQHGHAHPVALYVHWNGGLESVLAFMTFTWEQFDRGRDDLFTFHARLCQVIGNFFPDGMSLYGLAIDAADKWSADNGVFRFRVTQDGVTLPGRVGDYETAKRHVYWTNSPNIFDTIRKAMPAKDENFQPKDGRVPVSGEAEHVAG